MNVLSTILALLTTIPFLTFFIVFIVLKKITKRSTYSTKMAADLSVIFFLISINGLTMMLFDRLILLEIVVGFVILVGIFLFIQWRRDEDILLWRAVRIVWRIAFMLSVIGYLVLLIIAFIESLI